MGEQKRILMLGSGLYGVAFIRELMRESEEKISSITLGDIDRDKAEQLKAELEKETKYSVSTVQIDATDVQKVASQLKDIDLLINITGPFEKTATPVVKAAIENRIDYIDINAHTDSTREVLTLNEQAKKAGVSLLIGFGDTPGLVNILARYGADKLDTVEEIHIGGGGTPSKGLAGMARIWHNVISDPALIYKDGQVVEVPARGDKELIQVPGLEEPFEVMSARHTEVLTIPRFIPDVKLVTYKVGFYPKDISNDIFCTFFDWGLDSLEPIDVNGSGVAPADFALAFSISPAHRQALGRDKIPLISGFQVRVNGVKDGKAAQYTYRFRDPEVQMTQITLTRGVNLLLSGGIDQKGILAPEALDPEPFISRALERGMIIQEVQEVFL